MDKELEDIQRKVCAKFEVAFSRCAPSAKVGVSKNLKSGLRPINGLRIKPEGDTCGWYIWAGEEWSDDPEYFVPLHWEHLNEWAPLVLPFLALPPGWRFLVTEKYEDVWEDPQLLNSRR